MEPNLYLEDLEKRLIQGSSKRSISANIRKEKKSGKSQEQAVAIALETARRAKNERRRRTRLRRSLQTGVVSPATALTDEVTELTLSV